LKAVSTALASHLAQDCTSLAYLWKVTRTDGTILGFTTHDQDLTYLGTVYAAATGFTNTAVANKSDMSVDNLEVTAFLDSEIITEPDIRAGLYDGCDVEVRVVNWSDLTQGDVKIRKGTVGQVKMVNGVFTAELRGIANKLTTAIGSAFGPACRAVFGSGVNGINMNDKFLCHVDSIALRQNGVVVSSPDPHHVAPSGLTGATGWFNDGILVFTSGALNGYSYEIKAWDGTTLTIFLPMDEAPAPGDTFTAEPGCAHTIQDCVGKYNNLINFRGDPFLPSMDAILDYPNATS
jgi:uncharacterized phage protein (TIGR02218 family)